MSLIMEGRVGVLHMGPPCFSSLLAELTVKLALSQEQARGHFQIELPASSPVLELQPFKDLLVRPNTYIVVRHVCADGAPWQKPTAIISNSKCILSLRASCPGCKSHITLRGKAPDGRSWTSVASPYWPAFARRLAETWVWAKDSSRTTATAHLAGWAPASAENVTGVIETSGFTPSGKRAPWVVGTRVTTGSQPVRRALPQLFPEGLGCDLHLEAAHTTRHPFATPPVLTAPVEYALKHTIMDPRECKRQRERTLKTLEHLAAAVEGEIGPLLALIHPFISPVLAKRHLPFMREVSFATGWHDPFFVIDLAFGLPALGWAPRAPTMQARWAPPEATIDDLLVDLDEHNARVIRSTKPSNDAALNWAAWEKTAKELTADFITGPYESISDIPVDTVRLLRRFGTWEQQGGAEVPKCRLIDDALDGGQNLASGSQYTHRPADLDAWIAQLRAVTEKFPTDSLKQFTSDFASAYKQVPADPSLAGLATIAQGQEARFLLGQSTILRRQKLSCQVCQGARLGLPRHGCAGCCAHVTLRGRHPRGRQSLDDTCGLSLVAWPGAPGRVGRPGQEIPTTILDLQGDRCTVPFGIYSVCGSFHHSNRRPCGTTDRLTDRCLGRAAAVPRPCRQALRQAPVCRDASLWQGGSGHAQIFQQTAARDGPP